MTVPKGAKKTRRFLGKENSTIFMREKRAAVVFIFFSAEV
jgi:Asp-tRNA(Asn)/Glu-tRNA(Gln) amidotransferase B subunit